MVLAAIALFVALTGTAVAAGIVANAKLPLNAGKLQGSTAAQLAEAPEEGEHGSELPLVDDPEWLRAGARSEQMLVSERCSQLSTPLI